MNKEKMKAQLHIRLIEDDEIGPFDPYGESTVELIRSFRSHDSRNIYIISPDHSVSSPFAELLNKPAMDFAVGELIIDRLDKRQIPLIKNLVDDIIAKMRINQNCEIVIFRGGVAAVVLACLYVNASRNTELAAEQVRDVSPGLSLSEGDLYFINDFRDYISDLEGETPAPSVEKDEGPREISLAESGAVKEGMIEVPGFPEYIPGRADFLLRFRIRTKLLVLFSLVLAVSLTLMVFIANQFFKKDGQARIRENIRARALMLVEEVRGELKSSLETVRIAAQASGSGMPRRESESIVEEMLFREGNKFIFMGIARKHRDRLKFIATYYNNDFLGAHEFSRDRVRSIHEKNAGHFLRSFERATVLRNISPDMGMPVLSVSLPFREKRDAVSSIVVFSMPLDRFMDIFTKTRGSRSFLVNEQGDCVAYREANRIVSRVNMIDMPVVKKMLVSTLETGQMRYFDRDGRGHLGSFAKLDEFGLGVVTTAPEDFLYRELNRVERRNYLVLSMVLIVTIAASFMLTWTVSVPLDRLADAAALFLPGIARAVFPKEKDEIHLLTGSFREMRREIVETRRKLRDAAENVDRIVAERMKQSMRAGRIPEPDLRQFRTDDLSITLSQAGKAVKMTWSGRANIANPADSLNPYLDGVAPSLKGYELSCDFSSLETISTAAVQSIIRFAYMLDENRIPTTFYYNRFIYWQAASFEELNAVFQGMKMMSLSAV